MRRLLFALSCLCVLVSACGAGRKTVKHEEPKTSSTPAPIVVDERDAAWLQFMDAKIVQLQSELVVLTEARTMKEAEMHVKYNISPKYQYKFLTPGSRTLVYVGPAAVSNTSAPQ